MLSVIGKSDQSEIGFRLAAGLHDRHFVLTASPCIRGSDASTARPDNGRSPKPFRQIISGDTVGGMLLISATVAAPVFSNTSLNGLYASLLNIQNSLGIAVGPAAGGRSSRSRREGAGGSGSVAHPRMNTAKQRPIR
ncbi:hypothetical protein [Thalassobaculum fulvum]|uniref:hypothetical protein n=1 Tax=Thalassobaculum fulvum TaxID=1633335 RepID=UPI0016753998|nr:hypothetical protein [Thalassobaculum fulvum]